MDEDVGACLDLERTSARVHKVLPHHLKKLFLLFPLQFSPYLPTLQPRILGILECEKKDVSFLSFRGCRGRPKAHHKTYTDLLRASRRTPVSTRPANRLPEPAANAAE